MSQQDPNYLCSVLLRVRPHLDRMLDGVVSERVLDALTSDLCESITQMADLAFALRARD